MPKTTHTTYPTATAAPASRIPSRPRSTRGATAAATVTEASSGWVWPTSSTRITSAFEEGHRAIDISAAENSPLYAPVSGRIIAVNPGSTGYGNHIIIETPEGLQVLLGHLSAFGVAPNQQVNAGQEIGRTGNTGNSTGPHVHYEIRSSPSGRVDPLSLYTGSPQAPAAAAPARTTQGAIPQAAQEQPASPITQAIKKAAEVAGIDIPDISLKVNWGNVAAVVIGVGLISIGVFGLVLQESGKMVVKSAVQPVTDALKSALAGAAE